MLLLLLLITLSHRFSTVTKQRATMGGFVDKGKGISDGKVLSLSRALSEGMQGWTLGRVTGDEACIRVALRDTILSFTEGLCCPRRAGQEEAFDVQFAKIFWEKRGEETTDNGSKAGTDSSL